MKFYIISTVIGLMFVAFLLMLWMKGTPVNFV